MVDRVSLEEGLTRALLAAQVSAEQLKPESLGKARQTLLQAEPLWRTLAQEEEGFRGVAALMLENSPFFTSRQIERLGVALARYDDIYSPLPGIPSLLEELESLNIRQAVLILAANILKPKYRLYLR